jgi:hypothetical protein
MRNYKVKYRYRDNWTYLDRVVARNKDRAEELVLEYIYDKGRTNRKPDELIIEYIKKR